MKIDSQIRIVLFCLSACPLLFLSWLVIKGALGPDPAKTLALFTGEWTLIFLLVTLSTSSITRRSSRVVNLVPYRRQLGLWTFLYASLHVLVFDALYLGFDYSLFVSEFQERPYISVGGVAWFCLLLLALTSNRRSLARLGAVGWKKLHRLIYLAVVLAAIHVIWQIRADWLEAAAYSLVGALLLIERALPKTVVFWSKNDQPT